MQQPRRRGPACLAGAALLAAALPGWAPAADATAARLLRCTWPDGSSLGVVHRGGLPLALTAGATSGGRECATRSTRPPAALVAAAGDRVWVFEWHDTVLGDFFRAEVRGLPSSGFVVLLSAPAASGPGRVRCGPLSLPARAELHPALAACQAGEDRSEALQDSWRTLRQALLARDAAAFRGVLADQVELAEGASADSPRVAADRLALHLACVAGLMRGGVPLAEWARERPHILSAPTGLSWHGPGVVSLGGYARLAWVAGGWRLDGLNASRAVILRDCPPPPR